MRVRADQLCLAHWIFYVSVCPDARPRGSSSACLCNSPCPRVTQGVSRPSISILPLGLREQWTQTCAVGSERLQKGCSCPGPRTAARGDKPAGLCRGWTIPQGRSALPPTASMWSSATFAFCSTYDRLPTWTEASVDFPFDLETRVYLSRVGASAHFFHRGLRYLG